MTTKSELVSKIMADMEKNKEKYAEKPKEAAKVEAKTEAPLFTIRKQPVDVTFKDKEVWHEDVRQYIPAKDVGKNLEYDEAYKSKIEEVLKYNEIMRCIGNPGCGKDTEPVGVAGLHGWPIVRVDGNRHMETDQLVGYDVPVGGSIITVHTPLSRIVEHGGLLVLSEPNSIPAGTWMGLQHLFEPERIMKRPGAMTADSAQIKAHPLFRVIFTSNTLGTGHDIANYAGASELQDHSSLNRITMFHHKSYHTIEQQIKIIRNNFPEITEKLARMMVKLCELIRESYNSSDVSGDDAAMPLPWSHRQSLAWADKIVRRGVVADSFKDVYYNACNEHQKATLRKFYRDVGLPEAGEL